MHGAEVGEVDEEGSAQMCRYCAADQAITIEMKQLHWRNSYKPMHWHEFTKAQKEHILESHIFLRWQDQGQECGQWKQAIRLHH